jgi:lipid II:glycine glycyltransferase (peptidoglycan interpeptide bridge formation enzyme)
LTIVNDRETWQRFVSRHPQGHLLQTWMWGELKAHFGWQPVRLVIGGDDAVAGAQVLLRAAPGGWRVAYVPAGPLVNWADSAQAGALLAELHRLCRAHHCIFLKVEPPLPDTPALRDTIAGHGFRSGAPTVQPPRTILVDLTPPEEAILAAMKQKTRYNIRLAARKGVTVHVGNASELAAFVELMHITGRRDGFGIHGADYYRLAHDLFAPHNAALLMAHLAGEPVAGLMVFAHATTAYYLYGASGNVHRECMAPYLLQWEAMRWARAHGCHTYDLWGIPDAEEEALETNFATRAARDEGLWGVYRFKRGFGGRVVRNLGAFDYVYQRSLYAAYRLWMRWRRRQLPAG